MRKGAEPLAMEQLERAFGKVPGMTAADAGIVCKGALGILARNFEAGPAAALQARLEPVPKVGLFWIEPGGMVAARVR